MNRPIPLAEQRRPRKASPATWRWLVAHVLSTVALVSISQAGDDAGWMDLIGEEITQHWSPTVGEHWTTAGEVVFTPEQPDVLKLKPGRGFLYASGKTKTAEANLTSKNQFGDMRLEVEFMIPQGSNSGIYLMGRYELQIRDSYGKSVVDTHDCGAIYQRWDPSRGEGNQGYEGHAPGVNACKPPGEWQSFELEFRAPRFDPSGNKIADAVFTSVKHNGTLIQTNASLSGPTRGALFETEAATGPLLLQGNHGPIAFRKLRILPQGPKP